MTRQQLGEDGYISEEIAENLLVLDQPEKAQIHFETAWRLLSQDPWLQKHDSKRLQRLKQLGTDLKKDKD